MLRRVSGGHSSVLRRSRAGFGERLEFEVQQLLDEKLALPRFSLIEINPEMC